MNRWCAAAARSLQLRHETVLAFARRKVYLQPSIAGRIATFQFGEHAAGVIDAGVGHQAVTSRPVDRQIDHLPGRHLIVPAQLSKNRFVGDLRYAVDPNAGGRHGFAEAELNAIRRIAQIFAVQLAHRLHHRTDIAVLNKRVRGRALLLDVDLDDLAEHLEMQSQLTGDYVLLQVSYEQGLVRFRHLRTSWSKPPQIVCFSDRPP